MKNQTSYLLIGSGRLSRHFQKYLSLLKLNYSVWDRGQSFSLLPEKLQAATHVLLLISDSAIESFYQEHLQKITAKKIVHFSGALEISGVSSTHPLMTFSHELYALEDYRRIPFVTTSALPFSEILPGLPNPHYYLKPELKPTYHALCVLSGNFTNLLWQKMNTGMKSLGLPSEIFHPYLEKTLVNILHHPEGSLTGPLARKDLKTVMANDRALQGDAYQKIYRAFVETHFPEALKELGR